MHLLIIFLIIIILTLLLNPDNNNEKFNVLPGTYENVFLNRQKLKDEWLESEGIIGETLYSGYPPAYGPYVNFN